MYVRTKTIRSTGKGNDYVQLVESSREEVSNSGPGSSLLDREHHLGPLDPVRGHVRLDLVLPPPQQPSTDNPTPCPTRLDPSARDPACRGWVQL